MSNGNKAVSKVLWFPESVVVGWRGGRKAPPNPVGVLFQEKPNGPLTRRGIPVVPVTVVLPDPDALDRDQER